MNSCDYAFITSFFPTKKLWGKEGTTSKAHWNTVVFLSENMGNQFDFKTHKVGEQNTIDIIAFLYCQVHSKDL